MFAEVIVDVSASEVDKIFDYACDEDIGAGMRVLVPFGKGNKLIEGFVINVKSSTSFEKDKVKSVAKRLDDIAAISQELLQLATYLKYNYNLKMVDILRLFIPSQMRGGRIKELKRFFVSIADEYVDKTVQDLMRQGLIKSTAQNRIDIFCHLKLCKSESLSSLSQNFSTSAINALVDSGILVKTSCSVGRVPYSQISKQADRVELLQGQIDAIQTIKNDDKTVTLLHGVTGSGKTEVYLSLIDDILSKDKTAIMLVPEIGLTPQTLRIFRSKFGDSVAILHSGLSAGERFDEWKRLLLGQARVAIGARSAVFAPLDNLGIIIIDEEHDSSYISESNPRYNTVGIAKWRAEYNGCKLLLGSATPSIETYHLVKTGVYGLAEMPLRINKRPLPPLEIVDMRKQILSGNNSILSDTLIAEIDRVLSQGNKIMLFLNRRGYSSYVICKECGYVAKCSDCDVSLVYHKDENLLKCHFCNNRFAMLDICPNCQSAHIRRGYVGTQQVVEQVQTHFKNTGVLRMDNDTTQKKDSHLEILDKFLSAEFGILVGTQMIVKGHDFGNVALVGILDADMSLHFNDYRAVERTFQLITQASGRAGRASVDGKVVLQTYTPKHYVYKFALSGDYKGFFEKEYNLRQVTKYPPFCVLVRVLVSGESEMSVHQTLKIVFEDINQLSKSLGGFIYLACMRSPVKRIQNNYRMQVLCRIPNDTAKDALQNIYKIANQISNPKIRIFVEVNPSNLS